MKDHRGLLAEASGASTLTMRAKSLVLVCLVLALAAAGWFLLKTAPDRGSDDPETDRMQAPERTADSSGDPAQLAQTNERAGDRRVATPGVSPATAAPTLAAKGDHPWSGQFAGLTGRLVEADGTPAAGLLVELAGIDVATMSPVEHRPLGVDDVIMGSGVSDSEGRFLIDRARGSGFHVLLIDGGGARATVRFVEQSLEYGTVTDLGDVVLDAYGTVVGTVIDEDGEPVVGARVRLAAVPEIVGQSGTLDVREDSVLCFGEAGDAEVLDFAPFVMRLSDRMPAATTRTGEGGAFRLEGAPLGLISGGVDCDGHVSTGIGGFELSTGEHDIGEVELLFGRELSAEVVDAGGEAIQGAEVLIGTQNQLFDFGLLQPAGTSDAAGKATRSALPEEGTAIAAARRSETEDWSIAFAVGSSETVKVVLAETAPLNIRVTNEAGEPISAVEFQLLPLPDLDAFSMSSELGIVLKRPSGPTPAQEVAAGEYRFEGLMFGRWSIEARAPGLALSTAVHEHSAAAVEPVLIELQAGTSAVVRVTDKSSAEPIEGAHVAVLTAGGGGFETMVSGWTNASGEVTLDPLASLEAEQGEFSMFTMEGLYVLSVEHPRYAQRMETLDLEGEGPVDVALDAPASIVGRIHWAGEAPSERYMLMLEVDEAVLSKVMAPHFALSEADGTFRIGGLSAGKYSVSAMKRFLGGNPLSMISGGVGGDPVATMDVDVEAGVVTTLDIALDAEGVSLPGWFEGRVMLEGQPMAGAIVHFETEGETIVRTDGDGAFRSENFPSDQMVYVLIEEEVLLPDGESDTEELFSDWLYTKSNQATRIDIDLSVAVITIEVFDAETLEPIEGVYVFAYGGGSLVEHSTDEDGRIKTKIRLVGDEVDLNASLDGYLEVDRTVEVSDGRIKDTVTIKLVRATPCSGRALFAGDLEELEDESIVISRDDTLGRDSVWVSLVLDEDGDLTFETEELGPGAWIATFWNDDGPNKTAKFELGPEGSTDLVLDFTK